MPETKPKYEAPILVRLDQMAQASGDCADGSTVTDTCVGGASVVGTCVNGGLPLSDCNAGSSPGSRLCFAGGAYI